MEEWIAITFKAITFNLTLSKPPNIRKTVTSRALKNLDVEAFINAVNLGDLLDDNLCLASTISRYEQVLEDTLNQMAPIRSRLILFVIMHHGTVTRFQLKKG